MRFKWLMPFVSQYLLLVLYNVMCKPRLKCTLGSLARLKGLLYRRVIYRGHSIFIFGLCPAYLFEFTPYPNSMIEIAAERLLQDY